MAGNFLADRLGGQQRRTHDAHQRAIANSPHRVGHRDPRNVEALSNQLTAKERPEVRAQVTRSLGRTTAPTTISSARPRDRRGDELVGGQRVTPIVKFTGAPQKQVISPVYLTVGEPEGPPPPEENKTETRLRSGYQTLD